MTVETVAPAIDPATLLAGAQFMDAYRLAVDGAGLDARHAAERMMARAPRWIDALLVLRNIIVVFARFAIAEAFFGHGATGSGTIALTATLLVVGSTYFITDGIQTIVAGALRGLNDTRVPLLLAVVSYWLIGFTMACILGFRTELGAVGVWIGLSCGTLVYATLLILRFRKLASRFAA